MPDWKIGDSYLYNYGGGMEMHDTDALLKQVLSSLINAAAAEYGSLVTAQIPGFDRGTIALSSEGKEVESGSIPVNGDLVNRMETSKAMQWYEEGEGKEPGAPGSGASKSDWCLPLAWEGASLGYVYLFGSNAAQLFGGEKSRIMGILAAQAGVTLKSVILMGECQRRIAEIESTISESLEKHKRLDEELHGLNAADMGYDHDLISLFSETKNFLFTIQGYVQLFSIKTPAYESFKRTETAVNTACRKILDTFSNFLAFKRLKEGKFSIRKDILNDELFGAMIDERRNKHLMFQREVSIEKDLRGARFEIEADHDLFEHVAEILFGNALRNTPPGGKIVVGFAVGPRENVITFHDSGTPIPEGDREKLFEAGRKAFLHPYGLGLHFCRMVMDAHGGRIWVESAEGGNDFKLSFPRPKKIAGG
jgi:signal transduction histidine kinase